VAPVPLELQNCGQVIIRKQTEPQLGADSPDFGYTKSFNTDPTSVNTFTLKDDGDKDYGKTVLFGSGYTVDETTIPDNWGFTSLDCSASTNVTPSIVGSKVTFAIDSDTDVLDCTYTNTLQTVASSMTTAQKFLPNDSATITAPAGTGTLAGFVDFELFDNATCQGTAPIYTENDVAVSGPSSGVTVSTTNTTVTRLTTSNLSWLVSYDSTNPLQRDIPASCHESSDLTITNGGTVSSP
jgi:hypothetical protein